jgi:hypothetical protein
MPPTSRPLTLAVPDASMSVAIAVFPRGFESTPSATVAVITMTSKKKLDASSEPDVATEATD